MTLFYKISIAFILSTGLAVFSGCGSGQQSKNKESAVQEEEINMQLLEEKNSLKKFASDEFSVMNQKIRELNDQIKQQSEPLTEKQNQTLDEIQDMRVDLNNKLRNVVDISETEWEAFQEEFKNEMKELKAKVNNILEEF